MKRGTVAFVGVFLLSILCFGACELAYSIDSVLECGYVTQLWYDGYWKQVHEFNGTLMRVDDGSVAGHIAVWEDRVAPLEDYILESQEKGATAVLFIKKMFYPTGYSMYLITGVDRKKIKIPIFEASWGFEYEWPQKDQNERYKHENDDEDYQMPTLTPICPKVTPKSRINKIPNGSFIIIRPTINQFKVAADTPFQLIIAIIEGIWQTGIIIFGLYRIWQIYEYSEGTISFFSAGPIICALEVIGAFLRLIYSCIDPFWAWRVMPDVYSEYLCSISFPFSLTAGILLTFWWAEMLKKTSLKVKPFVSKYRTAAFVVIGILFAVEISCSSVRAFTKDMTTVTIIGPISAVVYCIVAIILTISYLYCAYSIWQRLKAAPGHSRNRASVTALAVRVCLSSLGYIVFIICSIAFAIVFRAPWGRGVPLNIGFLAHNWAATFQIVATKPPPKRRKLGSHTQSQSASTSLSGKFARSSHSQSQGSHFTDEL